MSCIFCQIIAGQKPAQILFEDEDLVVFRDIRQAAPVHLLIVPRRHIPSLNDLDGESAGLFGKMALVAKRMAQETGTAEGYRLQVNCGRKGGQIIDHLHMHLMGGWS